MSVILIIVVISLALALTITAKAQTNLKVAKAELSLDFDKAKGKLMIVGDTIVFVDDEKPEFSFVIDRDNIAGIDKDDDVLSIQTNNAVKYRSTEKMRFVFRLDDVSAEDFIKMDGKSSAKIQTVSTQGNTRTISSTGSMIYEVEHKHRLYGSCKGRIIISDDRISFESTDDRDHSRQWLFTDIKKVKRQSPYKLSVKPFTGDEYTLEILGQGIDITDFKKVEDKMAAVKASR